MVSPRANPLSPCVTPRGSHRFTSSGSSVVKSLAADSSAKMISTQNAGEVASRMQEAEEDETRKRREAAARKAAEEEARRKQEAEEEARKRREVAMRKAAEFEARRMQEADEETRKRREAATRKAAEEEARRKQEVEEEARKRRVAEAKKAAEEEARRKQEADEEARKRKEAEAKKAAEEEARRKHEADEEARKSEIRWICEAGEDGAKAAGAEAGVGMMIGRTNEGIIVVNSVAPGGPADRAGIRPGFRLLAVNDVKVDGSRTAHVHDLIKGPVGSTVQMMFAIDGEEHGDYDRKTLLGEVIASSFKVLRTDSRPSSSRVSSASEAITYFASPSHVTMTVVRAKLDRPSPSSVSTAVRMSGALATASPADSPVLKQRESTTPAHANETSLARSLLQMAPDPELLLPQSVADVYLMWPNTSSSEMGKTSSLELGGEHAPAIEYAACEDADAANKHTWTTTDTFMQQMQECETTPSEQMKENREPELDATISITVSSAVLLMEQEPNDGHELSQIMPSLVSPPRGGSASPLQKSPRESMNSWEAENEPPLTFFYSQLNPSKVRDVSKVLQIFRNDIEGLNVSLRKMYGIDLTASQEEIRQQAETRAQDSLGAQVCIVVSPVIKMEEATEQEEFQTTSSEQIPDPPPLLRQEEFQTTSSEQVPDLPPLRKALSLDQCSDLMDANDVGDTNWEITLRHRYLRNDSCM